MKNVIVENEEKLTTQESVDPVCSGSYYRSNSEEYCSAYESDRVEESEFGNLHL